LLGGIGRERFLYGEVAGHWRSALDVGMRIFRGYPLGRLGSELIVSRMDGVLRGIARDGVHVPAGVKLVEIDPRGRRAKWVGIDERGREIAEAMRKAVLQAPRPRLAGDPRSTS
jgi:hypothetical protein